MRRFFICFLTFLLTVFCFSGCQKQRKMPLCRVVTQVEITCRHKDLQIKRNYTSHPKMQAVFLYLRTLKPRGIPEENPTKLQKDMYEITMTLSDGNCHIYKQTAHRFFKAPNRPWMQISPQSAAGLYAIMARYESDRIV